MGSAVVAYTDPQGFFSRHEALVEQHLQHLTNLHWRPQPAALEGALPSLNDVDTATRTVPSLKLHIVPEGSHRQKQHQIPGLNNAPFVQILVIETAPLEIYRSKLRQIGKDWFHNQVEVREPTGYIVVHAISSNDSSKNARAIWSRLTAEFEPANCLQVNPADKSTWIDLRHLIQAQLTFAFDARISMLENEIKKLKATRDIPGWNFGALFAVHESLAWAYESMSLLDDSLKVYNSLEYMVGEIDKKEWAEVSQTASLTLVGDRDALIEPILSQKASIFDVQRHLLSRKASLLLSIASSKRHKAELVDSLADQFVFESIYLVLSKIPLLLQNLTKAVGEWNASLWLLTSVHQFYELITEIGSSKLSQGKGDLLLIERDAVQKLGSLKGWHIPGIFNEISLDETQSDTETKFETKVTLPKFEIETEDAFLEEFVKLTQQAILYHRIASHSRAVNRLTTQLLMIEYHKGNYEAAWEILQKNPALLQQASHSQTLIALINIALECAESLGHKDQVCDFAWKLIGLRNASLKTFENAINKIEKYEDSKPRTVQLSTWFEPKLIPYLRGDEDGYYYELELSAKQPDYPFVSLDSAKVSGSVLDEFTGAERPVLFESSALNRQERIKLYTKTFKEGLVTLDKIEVYHGNVSLVHDLQALVSAMHPLSNAFTADIVLAKQHTMKKRDIELRLKSPGEIARAKVTMQSMDSQSQLLWDKAEGGNNLTHFKDATIKLPILIDNEHSRCIVKVVVEYDRKSYELYKTLDFSLAVSVDFQEYFRQPPRILSQFFVKPFSSAPAIFTSATLTENQAYSVENFPTTNNSDLVAYNNAPISCVFNIAKREEVDPKKPLFMQLKVTYRSMLWESQKLLYTACINRVKGTELECYKPLISSIVERLCPSCDMIQYLAKGFVQLSDTSLISTEVVNALRFIDPQHAKKLHTMISSLLQEGVLKDSSVNFDDLNSTMVLDVPNPDAEVVHYVELNLEDDEKENQALKKYPVGSVINATLKIETISFQDQNLSEKLFEYELDRLSEGWSYTGKVKGVFRGSDGVKETLNLIPNRSAELQIPNVAVRTLNPSELVDDDDETDSDQSRITSEFDNTVIVAKHANNKILVVPDLNMLAITF